MALLTEERAKVAVGFLINLASWVAAVKAPTNWIFCWQERAVRYGLFLRTVDMQYRFQRSHNIAWSLCVSPCTALSWASAAAARSAGRRFCWVEEQF